MKFDLYNEDIAIMGKGGSGKTALLDRFIGPLMLKSKTRFWIWDTRHQCKLSGVPVVHTVGELPVGGSAIIKPYDISVENFDKFCSAVLQCANTVIAVDEVHLYASKQKFRSEAFYKITTTGRNQGNTLIAITRRPADTHNDIIADSDHKFIFNHDLPTDVAYLKKWIGSNILELAAKPIHTFYYKGPAEEGFYILEFRMGKVTIKHA